MAAVGFPLWPDAEWLPAVIPVLEAVDYVEVAPETLWGPGGRPNAFHGIARGLAEQGTPIVGHGVGLDPASVDAERRRVWLQRWRRDARQLGLRWASDHLGTTAIGGEPVALPVPAPESFGRLARTLDQLAAATGAPAAIENSAWYAYPGEALDEPARLTDALGDTHHLVLDLHNLWTNSINLGFDVEAWLARAPLDRVIEVHVSGGSWAPEAWAGGRRVRLDSHDEAVPGVVWQLLEEVGPRCPGLRGVTVERIEGAIEPEEVAALVRDVARARSLAADWGGELGSAPAVPEESVEVEAGLERSAAEERADAAMAAWVREPPRGEAGAGVVHRLIVKLRFGRLMRGDPEAEAWFERDPAGFTEAFRAFHGAERLCETPWEEAAAWRAWRG